MESPDITSNLGSAVGLKSKSFDDKLKEKYESFWLYSESHPWRLGQHITARGIFAGAILGFTGGLPYSVIKRRGQVLSSLGKITFRGSAVGGLLMGLVAAERLYSLDTIGITDRSYRISYNWGQTKWDYLAMDGALLGIAFFRRPFGGVFQAAAVGIAIGSYFCFGTAALA